MILIMVGIVMLSSCAGPGTSNEDAESAAPRTPALAPNADREIRLGVAAGRQTGQTPIDALIHVEQVLGRQVDVLRAYAFWDGEFPDLRHRWASDGGRMLHLSINARRIDGSVVPWRAIANASPGDPIYDELMSWTTRLAEYDAPLRVTFHHEPDIEPEFGNPEDFVAAWQRFVALLDEKAPDIETVWVMTSFSLDKPAGEAFWPGDDHVDVIGADAFNWFGCRGTPEAWRTPEDVLAPLMAFGANHPGKPLVLAELGSDEDDADPSRKAQWIDELAALVETDAYRALDTIVFFHNDHDDQSTCDWWLDSSTSTSDEIASLAALPLFGGRSAEPAPVQCPVVAQASSATRDLALVDGNGDGRFDFEFGGENRFLGIGDQSADGADHRLLLTFEPIAPLPTDATLELRLRIGEGQPALTAPVELRLLANPASTVEAFEQPGELLEPVLFDADSLGGHHVFDVTNRIDPTQESTVRLQLASAPPSGDGQQVLYMGMGDAGRSIDRPMLIARLCE